MPLRCQNCGTSFLLSPDGVVQGAACPDCGGTRLERDQPSPTHSDGDLRNMVDPSTGIDQGGNPLQEGIWATTDGGWQPLNKRDESFASVRTAMDFNSDGDWDFTDKTPTHKFIVDGTGRVHSAPNPTTHEAIANANGLLDLGYPKGMSLGELNSDGSTGWYQHDTPHSAQGLESMLYGHFGTPVQIDPNLRPTTNEERWGLPPAGTPTDMPAERLRQMQDAETQRGRPFGYYDNPFINRGGSVLDEVIPQDPYMPWWVEASVEKTADEPIVAPQQVQERAHRATVQPGELGIHNGTVKWLQFLDATVDGLPARSHWQEIAQQHGIPGQNKWGQPVEVAVHHPGHLPGAVDVIQSAANGQQAPEGLKNVALSIAQGQVPPPPGINPAKLRFSGSKMAFLPLLAPLIGAGAEAIGGAGAAGIMGGLMRGALMGTGSHMVQGLLGGGEQDGAGQLPSMPPDARDVGQLASVKNADLETPSSNPGYHDSPDGDTKQFDDQSTDPAFQNPNQDAEAGGAADGEDNVGAGIGAQFSPHTLERANLLLPLIMHYHNSEESGANDALLRELHAQLDQEVPGYLDQADDQGTKALIQKLREPQAIAASTKESMDPFGQQGQVGFQDPWGDNRDVNPAQTQFAPGQGQGRCPYCGGTTTADGSCPQCGATLNPQGGAMPPQGIQSIPPVPGVGTPQTSVAPPGWRAKVAADHQGPVTDEQKAAVAELLNQTGRHDEVPAMLREPWNYAKEMAAVANKVNTVPNVDPNEQAPPAPPQMGPAPNGGLPPGMPNPADPSMMPQASTKKSSPHPGAPRCPKCHSATTGVFHNGLGDMSGECHACGNIWPVDAQLSREAADDTSPANPVAAPAADQQDPYNPEADQDSSHTWQDDSGAPLVPGQVYEMHSPQYSIPDIIKIEQVKPDAIVVNMVGEYNNTEDPNAQQEGSGVSYRHEIPKEEIDLEKITFTPAPQDSEAGDQSLQEYQDRGQAPVNTEPVEQSAIDPRHTSVQASEDVRDPAQEGDLPEGTCPKCASTHVASTMSSPTSSFHECYRCGNAWETKEEDFIDQNTANRDWIMSSGGPGGDDFFAEMERHKAMREAGGASTRNISDIARRDPRLQEIHERLEANKTAGRKFSPHEQRQFIDEEGVARNADKLDLAGTHYEDRHRYVGDKANGANVPEEQLFMGFF